MRLIIQFNEEMDELLGELARKKGVSKMEILRRSVALLKYVYGGLKTAGYELSIVEDGKWDLRRGAYGPPRILRTIEVP